MNNNNVGLGGLLWLLLIAMKLMGYLHWSWLIVILFPVLLGVGLLAVAAVLVGLAYLVSSPTKKRRVKRKIVKV